LQGVREEVSLESVTLGVGISCVSLCCSAIEGCTFGGSRLCVQMMFTGWMYRTLLDVVLANVKFCCFSGGVWSFNLMSR
jgi:hypothetical protein